jgi:hypothetical protein
MRGPAFYGFYPAADRYSEMSSSDFAAMIMGRWLLTIGAVLFIFASVGTHFADQIWPAHDTWCVIAAITGGVAGGLASTGAVQLWRGKHGGKTGPNEINA